MAREPGQRVDGIELAGDVRDPGCNERELAASAGSGDRDERKRERLPLAGAEIGRGGGWCRQPHRDDDLTDLERDERAVSVGLPKSVSEGER